MSAKVAIVGAGPSGCYLAQALLKHCPDAEVTIIDRLPVPYGLVRYGVAPDHQGTKIVTRQFARLFERQGVEFIGNIELGKDFELSELKETMDVTVLSTGLYRDNQFDVPGNDVAGIYGSGEITRFWNGHPDSEGFSPQFGKTVAILGNGNVAVDLVRLLIKGEEGFEGSDFDPGHVNNGVNEIHVIGRSPLENAKFDPVMIKELGGVKTVSFELAAGDTLSDEENPKVAALSSILDAKPDAPAKKVVFHSAWQLDSFEGENGQLKGLALHKAGGTEKKAIACDSAITAIGFGSQGRIDRASLIGAAEDIDAGVLGDGVFAAGWFKRGPTGTIPENRADSQRVAKHIAAFISSLSGDKPGKAALLRRFAGKATNYKDWQAIDAAEQAAAIKGRCRAKLTTYDALIRAAKTGEN